MTRQKKPAIFRSLRSTFNRLCGYHARVFFLFYFDLSFSLLIDVPYSVTILGSKGGCSYINLTWSQPSHDAEGGKVVGYLTQMKLASPEEPWLNWTITNVSLQSSQSYVFTQLKPNSEYYVTIMAQNKMGYGWPSEMKKVSTIQAGNFFRKFLFKSIQSGMFI